VWCIFPCHSVLFVSTSPKRLAVKTTLVISIVSKGFPYKDQIEELFIVMAFVNPALIMCVVYFHHVTSSTFSH